MDSNYKVTLRLRLRCVFRLIQHEKVYEHKKKLTIFLTYANMEGK